MTNVRGVFWWIHDYLNDTRHLTRAQHGSYLLLLFHYYLNGGLPNDQSALARIALMSRKTWLRERRVLLDFFTSDFKHKRCEAELRRIKKSVKHSVKQRDAHYAPPQSENSSIKSKRNFRLLNSQKNSSFSVERVSAINPADAANLKRLCRAARIDPDTLEDSPRGKAAKRLSEGSKRGRNGTIATTRQSRSRKPSTTQREEPP